MTIDSVYSRDYHLRQHAKPYRSTEMFVDWLETKDCFHGNILDIGCGMGANLNYMAERFKDCNFIGLDYEPHFLEYESRYKKDNTRMIQGDAYNLPSNSDLWGEGGVTGGIVSFQFLSWIRDVYEAIGQMIDLKPQWIAASALFTEGLVEYEVTVHDYNSPTDGCPYSREPQNIYSLLNFKEYFAGKGYAFDYEKFIIDIDIPAVDTKKKGTYTQRLENGERLQISANFLMPWYFIYAEKK
jgi:SAM-dependent methyltransferase